jgi:hypothetical protein
VALFSGGLTCRAGDFSRQPLLTSFEGRNIFVGEVRMGFQADSERGLGPGRKRKLFYDDVMQGVFSIFFSFPRLPSL